MLTQEAARTTAVSRPGGCVAAIAAVLNVAVQGAVIAIRS